MITLQEAGTLPKVNIFADPVLFKTFENYLGSILYLGLPVLLILCAIIAAGYVINMVIDVFKKAQKDDSEDWEDSDDDW